MSNKVVKKLMREIGGGDCQGTTTSMPISDCDILERETDKKNEEPHPPAETEDDMSYPPSDFQLCSYACEKLLRVRRTVSLADIPTMSNHWDAANKRRRLDAVTPSEVIANLRRNLGTPEAAVHHSFLAFILNAWRSDRVRSQKVNKLSEERFAQITQLNLSSAVLKKLLESERTRVAEAARKLQQISQNLERARSAKDALQRELDLKRECLERADNRTALMKKESMNLKNKMDAANLFILALKKQLQDAKHEKDGLIKEIADLRKTIENKDKCVEQLVAESHEFNFRIVESEKIAGGLSAELQVYKRKHEDLNRDNRALRGKISRLESFNADLETKLEKEDEERKKCQEQCLQHALEAAELRMTLETLRHTDKLWLARVLQTLNSILKVPVKLILYTSFPFPLSRSQ
ncbi:unnamed protein product [Bemisia tabaci]|uniref:Uncharacterized protein n=1 Tax=Bemisia tabaci TaxID=7038 RepID=A0A9P0A806_BEMTA|nr:unnamed protein product [Bemisia tabaci]